MTAQFEKRLQRVEDRVKRIEKELTIGGMFIASFDWKQLNPTDRSILDMLLQRSSEGATTTEIAEALNIASPETSGRTLIYMRLKRIERISKRLKGAPIVIAERKRWYLNYEEFSFPEAKK